MQDEYRGLDVYIRPQHATSPPDLIEGWYHANVSSRVEYREVPLPEVWYKYQPLVPNWRSGGQRAFDREEYLVFPQAMSSSSL